MTITTNSLVSATTHINGVENGQTSSRTRLTSQQALAMLIAAAPGIQNIPKAPSGEAAGKKHN